MKTFSELWKELKLRFDTDPKRYGKFDFLVLLDALKQSKTETTADLNSKVDKEEGKGLSTNDYTNADKNKVTNVVSFPEAPVDDKQYVRRNGAWEKISIAGSQIQSDWNQTNTEEKDFIKNKPTIPSIEGLETSQHASETYAAKTSVPNIFVGTLAEWDELTEEEKEDYTLALITE